MSFFFKNRNLLLIFICSFFFMGNEALLVAALPIYLSDLDFSTGNIGIVVGSFAVGVLFLRPAAGKLVDSKSRKSVMMLGILIFAVSPICYMISSSLLWLICVRIFHGFGISLFTTASPSMVIDITPKEHRGSVLGYMALASNFALGIGPIIGLSLLNKYGPFFLFLSCSLLAISALLAAYFLDNLKHKIQNGTKIVYRKVVLQRTVLVSAFVFFIGAIISSGISTFLPIHLKEFTHLNVGLYFLTYSLTLIISRFFTAHLSDRYGRGPIFFYAFFVAVCTVLLISNINSLAMLVLVGAIFGFASSIYRPALTALVADQTKAENRGVIFSFFYAAYDIGIASAGIILGTVADLYNFEVMFKFASMLGFVGLLLFLFYIKPKPVQSLKWTLTLQSQREEAV